MKICKECGREYHSSVELCDQDGSRLITVTLGGGNDPLIGTVIDERFQIEARLGQGGMGTVYRAHQLSMSRTVAVKIMQPHLTTEPAAVQRFFREARAASQLQHPNTITTYDFGQSKEGYLYIAMEHLDGSPLDRVLEAQGTLGFVDALEIVHQVCGSLIEAHEKGIIHRDLKPENIMLIQVEDRTLAKVLDFGIAKMGDAISKVTKTGSLLGTPIYMAPEQSRGEAVDPRADTYSLGVMLYEMLLGTPPFASLSEIEVMVTKIEKPEVDTRESEAGAHVPEPIRQLILAMSSGEPSLRPDARELQQRIEAIIEGLAPEHLSTRVSASAGTLSQVSRGPTAAGPVVTRLRMASQLQTTPDRAAAPTFPDRVSTGSGVRSPVVATLSLAGLVAAAAIVLLLWDPFTSRGRSTPSSRQPTTESVADGEMQVQREPDARRQRVDLGAPVARTDTTAPTDVSQILAATRRPDVVVQRDGRLSADIVGPVLPLRPKLVTIRVESLPRGARIFRGGKRTAVGVTPFELRSAPDQTRKERLVLQRKGYRLYVLQVQFDTNRTYSVSLVKRSSVPSKRRGKRKYPTSELK